MATMWFKIEICPIVHTDGCRKQGEVVRSLLAWKESLLSQYPLTRDILILSFKAKAVKSKLSTMERRNGSGLVMHVCSHFLLWRRLIYPPHHPLCG